MNMKTFRLPYCKKTIHPNIQNVNNKMMVCLEIQDFKTILTELLESLKVRYGEMVDAIKVVDELEQSGGTMKNLSDLTPDDLKSQPDEQLQKEDIDTGDYSLVAEIKKIGFEQIKKARGAKGLTQAELARQSGLNQSRLSRIEANPERTTAQELSALAKVLGIDIVIPKE
jgi:DNA-binding transcriptional regulator YiaG